MALQFLYDGYFAGSVGIGTASPDEALDVEHGNIKIKSDNDGNNGIFMLYDSAGTQSGQIYPSAGDLRLYSPNDIIMLQDGNVGIGTDGPDYPLEVIGKSASSDGFHKTGSQGVILSVGSGLDTTVISNGWTSGVGDWLRLEVPSADDEAGLIQLNSNGNVGIGTTSPLVKLQVYGEAMPETDDAASVEEMLTLYRNGSSTVWSGGATLALGRYSTAGSSSPKSRLDFKLKAAFGSNTALPETTVMTMQSNVRVGIGTITPTARLDITNGEGKFCVDSKTHALTNAFTTCLTVNLNSHTGCYVTITCFGDWGSHSAAAYRGEFFLQNGANGYSEPGIILRQDDNTSNGTDQIVCQILDPTSTTNPKNFEIQIRTTATTGTTNFVGQLTYTVQGKFNSVT